MSHLVFLVHGMGVYEDASWADSYINALESAHGQYALIGNRPMSDLFTFVPIIYDDIFREVVKTWADNAEIISKAAQATGAAVAKLTNWLKGAGELNGNFGWTHAADVLLYKAFSLVRERVCVRVGKQLVDAITKQIETDGRSQWSVVAHSLGTAVMHDTLARLWKPNATWPGNIAFSAQNEQAHLIAMVANVSRVLETKTQDEDFDVYKSCVMPGRSAQMGRGCRYYFTSRHKLDPFTIPSMFNPQMWPDEEALLAKPPRYLYSEVDHIHDWNVHAFDHYVKHPKVHVPLLRRLYGEDAISAEEYDLALAKFRQFGPLEDAAAIRIRQKIEDTLESQSADWTVMGKLWKTFIEAGLKGQFK